MKLLHQTNHRIETPDDGDPRWPLLLARMRQVTQRFGPLPDCGVDEMVCFFIARPAHAKGDGYTETIYMASPADMERFARMKMPDIDWGQGELYALAHPQLTVSDLLDHAALGRF